MVKKINIESLKIKAFVTFIIVIAVLASFKIYDDYIYYDQNIKDQKKFLLKQVKFVFTDEIKRINYTMNAKLNRISNDKTVLKAFKEKDRDKLYEITKIYFSMIKEYLPYLSKMNFYLNDYTSFLRVNKPELYGDNIKETRPMVTKAIKTQTKQIGFESSVIEPNKIIYRIVLPLYDDKIFLGALELGIDLGQIVDKTKNLISKLYGTDINMHYITKKELVKHQNDNCDDNFFKRVIPKIEYKKKNIELNIDNRIYYIFWDEIFLKDYKKDDFGTIIYGFDITQIKKEYTDSLMFDYLKSFIAIIILIYFTNHLFDFINKSFQEQTNHMLKQSRLAQMGEMISMIAHQWRQPLAAISSTAANLELKTMLDDYNKEYFTKEIQNIADYSKHLSSTINDFREFFKFNKTMLDTTSKELIEGTLKIISTTLETKNIKLIIKIESNHTVNTFPNEFKQVLLNLIKNAEDVLLEQNISNPVISIRTYRKKNKLYFKVEDNGGGIPKKYMDQIFNPYFTTKEKKEGTGLGLYMSKTIIEDHCHGTITASNSKKGAVFEIVLPISK